MQQLRAGSTPSIHGIFTWTPDMDPSGLTRSKTSFCIAIGRSGSQVLQLSLAPNAHLQEDLGPVIRLEVFNCHVLAGLWKQNCCPLLPVTPPAFNISQYEAQISMFHGCGRVANWKAMDASA